MHKGSQFGPTPEGPQVLQGQERDAKKLLTHVLFSLLKE